MSKEDILNIREKALSLFEQYEPMLTLSQRKIFSSYYQYDLSLSEIAEQENISRAAVHDSLTSSIDKMEEIEGKLHLVARYNQLQTILKKHENESSNTFIEEIEQWLLNH